MSRAEDSGAGVSPAIVPITQQSTKPVRMDSETHPNSGKVWFYTTDDDEIKGPVRLNFLKYLHDSELITDRHLVWCQSMSDWCLLGAVKDRVFRKSATSPAAGNRATADINPPTLISVPVHGQDEAIPSRFADGEGPGYTRPASTTSNTSVATDEMSGEGLQMLEAKRAALIRRLQIQIHTRKAGLRRLRGKHVLEREQRDRELKYLCQQLHRVPPSTRTAALHGFLDHSAYNKLEKLAASATLIQSRWRAFRSTTVVKEGVVSFDTDRQFRAQIRIQNQLQRNVTATKYDERQRWLTDAMGVVVFCSLVLTGIILQVSFDQNFTGLKTVLTIDLFQYQESGAVVTSLRVCNSALTLVLLVLITMYYQTEVLILSKISQVKTGLFQSSLRSRYLLELALLAVHDPPFLNRPQWDDVLAITTILRIYLLPRIIRDHSKIYRDRRDLIGGDAMFKDLKTIDWAMSMKTLFTLKQTSFVFGIFLVFSTTFSFIIYVLERSWIHDKNEAGVQERVDSRSLGNVVYLSAATGLQVGYGDVVPETVGGQVAATFTALVGYVFAATVTSYVVKKLQLSQLQLYVVDWMESYLTDRRRRTVSAVLIQRTWRFKCGLRQRFLVSNGTKGQSQNKAIRRQLVLCYRLLRAVEDVNAQLSKRPKLKSSTEESKKAEKLLQIRHGIAESNARLLSQSRTITQSIIVKRTPALKNLYDGLATYEESLKNTLEKVTMLSRHFALETELHIQKELEGAIPMLPRVPSFLSNLSTNST